MRKLTTGAALTRCPSRSRSSVKAGRIIVAGSGAEERTELRIVLELEGHQVAEAETASRTLQESCGGRHHLLILASGFEGIEPHALCRRIRLKAALGIIIVAGNDTTQARIDAWNAGADDYLSSPFVYRELLALVRAVLRRVTHLEDDGPEIVLHDRTIDLQSHEIRGPGSRVSRLTPKEFLALQFLAAHPGMAFTHRNLAQTAWQQDGAGKAEYMRSVIRQLRLKLESDPNHPRYIVSESSAGYSFQMPPAAGQCDTSELASPLEAWPGLWAETKWEQPAYST
jgi:two-component system KDP operon response regulator KdpE